MAKSAQNVTPSRDIPFNKLVLSQSNVRRIKAGISVEESTDDIARRRLLQSLNFLPVLTGDGSETGKFEIPAGGRRFQALSLLVKQKRLATTSPLPSILQDATSAILARMTLSLRTCCARLCIRSIISASSSRCGRRVKAMKGSQPPSSSCRRW